jgi:hypothetical protein
LHHPDPELMLWTALLAAASFELVDSWRLPWKRS